MLMCHCESVSDRTIGAAVMSGAQTVADVTARCRAGGGCGGCHSSLQALIDAVVCRSQPTGASAA